MKLFREKYLSFPRLHNASEKQWNLSLKFQNRLKLAENISQLFLGPFCIILKSFYILKN